MTYFNDTNRSGGGRSFGGGRPNFNNRSSGGTMHKATCSRCGKECEVPFRPTGSKPVYCNDCFREVGGSENRGDSRRSEGGNFSRQEAPNYGKQFEQLNNKLDKILRLLAPDAGLNEAPVMSEKKAAKKAEKPVIISVDDLVTAPVKKKKATKKVAKVGDEVVDVPQETETPEVPVTDEA